MAMTGKNRIMIFGPKDDGAPPAHAACRAGGQVHFFISARSIFKDVRQSI
jgi:hypothetical protein